MVSSTSKSYELRLYWGQSFFASGAQKLNRSLDGVTSVNTMKPDWPSPPSRRTYLAGIYLQDWLLENSVFTEFTAFLTPGTEWGIEEAQNTEKRPLMSIWAPKSARRPLDPVCQDRLYISVSDNSVSSFRYYSILTTSCHPVLCFCWWSARNTQVKSVKNWKHFTIQRLFRVLNLLMRLCA